MGSTLLKERNKAFNLVKSPKNNKLRKFKQFSTPNLKNSLNRRDCYIRTQRVVSNRKRRVRVTGLKKNRVRKFDQHYSYMNDDGKNNNKSLFLYVLFGAVMSVIWNI